MPDSWTLLVPAAAAIGVVLVGVFRARHLAPFVLMLYFGLILTVQLPNNSAANILAVRVAVGLVLAFVLTVGVSICRTAYAGTPEFRDWKVVEGLRQAGIPSRRKSRDTGVRQPCQREMARLAACQSSLRNLHLDIRSYENEFWNLSETSRGRVLSAFAQCGRGHRGFRRGFPVEIRRRWDGKE